MDLMGWRLDVLDSTKVAIRHFFACCLPSVDLHPHLKEGDSYEGGLRRSFGGFLLRRGSYINHSSTGINGKSCRKNIERSYVVGVRGEAAFDAHKARLSLSVVF